MGCNSDTSKPSGETVKDSEQNEHRIIAATYAIVEIMDALEIDLVAIPTTIKEIPERYKGLPEIGNAMSPDMEVIKSLNPTDVISVTTLEYDLAPGFEALGVDATFTNLQSYEELKKTIISIGDRYDRSEQAAALVEKYDEKIEAIKIKNQHNEKPSVLILLGVPGSYLVATEHSYTGNLVELIGAKNAIQGQNVEYLASNTEYLHESNPDIILRLAHGMPDEVVKMFDQEFQANDIWKHFDAVKNNKVYDLEEELFGTTAALNVDLALDQLSEIIYP